MDENLSKVLFSYNDNEIGGNQKSVCESDASETEHGEGQVAAVVSSWCDVTNENQVPGML